jgi:DNA modification methylase
MIDLKHGNCLDLMKDIPDASIDMILCDLPYGTTACKWDTVIPFEPLWEQYKRIIKANGAIVLFGSQPFTSVLVSSNLKMFKHSWVWNKAKAANFPQVKRHPLKVHEDILVFSQGNSYTPIMTIGKTRQKGGYFTEDAAISTGSPKKINDIYYPKTILDFSIANNLHAGLHPTQKPVALLEYLIKTYTLEGETILDNCMGSGSTGIACLNTGRNFIGIEMDDTYFEVAKNRIENHK